MLTNPPQPGAQSGQSALQENQQQNNIQPDLFPPIRYASVPVGPDKVDTEHYTRSLVLSDNAERELLRKCNTFKLQTLNHSKYRKINQQRNYAYFTNQFFGDDLLPLPSTDGSDRDENSSRPQVFYPIIAEQLLQRYAFTMIRLFPNDEDFFRIKAKTEEYAVYEDDLTLALQYLFKEHKITQQIGRCVMNALWSGHFAGYPTFELNKNWQWMIDQQTGDYQLQPVMAEPKLIVQEINPIHLYLDPLTSTNPRTMVLGWRKSQEILDSPFTIQKTKDRINRSGGKAQPLTSQYQEGIPISAYNQVNNDFIDYEKWLMWDTFYFPYIELDGVVYPNMEVRMVDNSIITEFRPVVAFKNNPLIQAPWRFQTESNYGFGPADDMQNLQIQMNMLVNYVLEWLARNGNVWVVNQNVDLKDLFGAIARVLIAPDGTPVSQAVQSIEANPEVLRGMMELIGLFKGEVVNIGGSQDPFQGQPSFAYKKTATEVTTLESNAVSRGQQDVEHISPYVATILEHLAFLAAHLYPGPITVRIDNPQAAPLVAGVTPGPQDQQLAAAEQTAQAAQAGQPVQPTPPPQGPFFRQIDLSIIRTGQFVVEMTGVNAAQSKEAEAQLFMELIEMASSNPQGVIMCEAFIEKIATLNGVKDWAEAFDTFKQRFQEMQAAQQQAAIQAQAVQQMQERAQEHHVMNNAQSPAA